MKEEFTEQEKITALELAIKDAKLYLVEKFFYHLDNIKQVKEALNEKDNSREIK